MTSIASYSSIRGNDVWHVIPTTVARFLCLLRTDSLNLCVRSSMIVWYSQLSLLLVLVRRPTATWQRKMPACKISSPLSLTSLAHRSSCFDYLVPQARSCYGKALQLTANLSNQEYLKKESLATILCLGIYEAPLLVSGLTARAEYAVILCR